MKFFLIILAFISISSRAFCQISNDKIVGKWITTPKENMIIEVYKVNDEYKGKIAWVKDPSDKSKPIGFEVLDKLTYNPETDMWENGKIYDPKSGKVFNSSAKLDDDTSLEVEGYWRFKFLGRTMKFRRVYIN